MWGKILGTVLKYLGLPIIKFLINKLIEYLKARQVIKYKQTELLKVKLAYEMVTSEDKQTQLEGVKKFEEIFNDFK